MTGQINMTDNCIGLYTCKYGLFNILTSITTVLLSMKYTPGSKKLGRENPFNNYNFGIKSVLFMK